MPGITVEDLASGQVTFDDVSRKTCEDNDLIDLKAVIYFATDPESAKSPYSDNRKYSDAYVAIVAKIGDRLGWSNEEKLSFGLLAHNWAVAKHKAEGKSYE